MKVSDLVRMAAADDVQMTLTPSGRLKLSGDQDAIDRWLGTVGQYSDQIIAELSARAESGPMAPQCPAAGASASTASADATGRLP